MKNNNNILKENSNRIFDSIIQDVENKDFKSGKYEKGRTRRKGLYPSIDSEQVHKVLEDVHRHFKLDDGSPYRYDIDPIKLKDFVRKSANLYINCISTLNLINSVINNESLDSISVLHTLYDAGSA